jgi:hypothetical protein
MRDQAARMNHDWCATKRPEWTMTDAQPSAQNEPWLVHNQPSGQNELWLVYNQPSGQNEPALSPVHCEGWMVSGHGTGAFELTMIQFPS